MAIKLDLKERARIALGDFDYTQEMLREKMAAIYEQDAREKGIDEFSIGLARALIVRDGNLDALGRRVPADDGKGDLVPVEKEAAETVESPANKGRGGDRGGRRPKVLPADARPRSFRCTEEEARIIRKVIYLCRTGLGSKIAKYIERLI